MPMNSAPDAASSSNWAKRWCRPCTVRMAAKPEAAELVARECVVLAETTPFHDRRWHPEQMPPKSAEHGACNMCPTFQKVTVVWTETSLCSGAPLHRQ